MATTAFSDMLTENIKDVLDVRGRIVVDRWKGMTKDQLDAIRHQQLEQIEERRVRTLLSVFNSISLFLET